MLLAQDIDRSLKIDEDVDVTFGFLLSTKERMAGPLTKPVREVRYLSSQRVGVLDVVETGRQVWQVFSSVGQTFDQRRAFWNGVNNLTFMRRNEVTKGLPEPEGGGLFGLGGFDGYERIAIGCGVLVLVFGLFARGIPAAFGIGS